MPASIGNSLRKLALSVGKPALATASLLISYLAALSAVADNKTTNFNVGMFSIGDQANPWLLYRGALIEQSFPLECNGMAFWHYDPSISIDYSKHPDPTYVRIGQSF